MRVAAKDRLSDVFLAIESAWFLLLLAAVLLAQSRVVAFASAPESPVPVIVRQPTDWTGIAALVAALAALGNAGGSMYRTWWRVERERRAGAIGPIDMPSSGSRSKLGEDDATRGR